MMHYLDDFSSSNKDCPVCGKLLNFDNYYGYEWRSNCDNGCFDLYFVRNDYIIYVFDENFQMHWNDNWEKKNIIAKVVKEKFRYWKENDRYLAEILIRG